MEAERMIKDGCFTEIRTFFRHILRDMWHDGKSQQFLWHKRGK